MLSCAGDKEVPLQPLPHGHAVHTLYWTDGERYNTYLHDVVLNVIGLEEGETLRMRKMHVDFIPINAHRKQ